MIKWYTVKDIIAGYSLSKWKLAAMCRSGEIGAMRVRDNRYKHGKGQFLIPESELLKLAAFKTGEPLYKEEHQPSEYLTLRNEHDEVERMTAIIGDYEAYLHSSQWKNIRDKAFKRDGYTCQICGTGKNLRVHHIHYEHVGSEEEINDVITLCDECHSKVHMNDTSKGSGHE